MDSRRPHNRHRHSYRTTVRHANGTPIAIRDRCILQDLLCVGWESQHKQDTCCQQTTCYHMAPIWYGVVRARESCLLPLAHATG